MKITLLCVGKLKESYFAEAAAEYAKRLKIYSKIKIIEIEKPGMDKGSAAIEKHLTRGVLKIALVIGGKQMSSKEFAEFIQYAATHGTSEIMFIIGGAYGLSDSVIEKCDYRLSLSKFTFPHQLARVILLEQLYRAFTIIGNTPYNK